MPMCLERDGGRGEQMKPTESDFRDQGVPQTQVRTAAAQLPTDKIPSLMQYRQNQMNKNVHFDAIIHTRSSPLQRNVCASKLQFVSENKDEAFET